jgi:hypothetical protein
MVCGVNISGELCVRFVGVVDRFGFGAQQVAQQFVLTLVERLSCESMRSDIVGRLPSLLDEIGVQTALACTLVENGERGHRRLQLGLILLFGDVDLGGLDTQCVRVGEIQQLDMHTVYVIGALR